MKKYIDISNSTKTSLYEKLHNKGVKLFEENNKQYLEFKGKAIVKPLALPEKEINEAFNLGLKYNYDWL